MVKHACSWRLKHVASNMNSRQLQQCNNRNKGLLGDSFGEEFVAIFDQEVRHGEILEVWSGFEVSRVLVRWTGVVVASHSYEHNWQAGEHGQIRGFVCCAYSVCRERFEREMGKALNCAGCTEHAASFASKSRGRGRLACGFLHKLRSFSCCLTAAAGRRMPGAAAQGGRGSLQVSERLARSEHLRAARHWRFRRHSQDKKGGEKGFGSTRRPLSSQRRSAPSQCDTMRCQ